MRTCRRTGGSLSTGNPRGHAATDGSPSTGNPRGHAATAVQSGSGSPCRHAAARRFSPVLKINVDMPPHRRFAQPGNLRGRAAAQAIRPAQEIHADMPPHGRFAQHRKSTQTCRCDGSSVRQRKSMRTCRRDGRQRFALRRKTPACLRCPAPWRAYSAFLPDSQIWRISS